MVKFCVLFVEHSPPPPPLFYQNKVWDVFILFLAPVRSYHNPFHVPYMANITLTEPNLD